MVHIVRCPECHYFFLTYATRSARCRRCGSCFGVRSRAETRIVHSFESPRDARVFIGLLNSVGPMTIDQARHLIEQEVRKRRPTSG